MEVKVNNRVLGVLIVSFIVCLICFVLILWSVDIWGYKIFKPIISTCGSILFVTVALSLFQLFIMKGLEGTAILPEDLKIGVTYIVLREANQQSKKDDDGEDPYLIIRKRNGKNDRLLDPGKNEKLLLLKNSEVFVRTNKTIGRCTGIDQIKL